MVRVTFHAMATNTEEVLSYRSPAPGARRGRNRLAVVAFVAALVFNPFLRNAVRPRPFWTGHPLQGIRELVDSTPLLVLPLPGLVLGLCALAHARLHGRRFGLALAATVIGITWYVILGGLFLYMVIALRGWS
jgi:hypothetical protein